MNNEVGKYSLTVISSMRVTGCGLIPLAAMDGSALWYVVKGDAILQGRPAKASSLGEGTLMVLSPGMQATLLSAECRLFGLQLNHRLSQLPVCLFPQISENLRNLVIRLAVKETNPPFAAPGAFAECLGTLVSSETIARKESLHHLKLLEEIFRVRYHEAHSLETLSEELRVSKQRLIRDCNRYWGASPMEALAQRRLEEGRQLLEQTDLSAVEIAELIGFHSASYFSQCFKKRYHLPPQMWRRTAQLQRHLS